MARRGRTLTSMMKAKDLEIRPGKVVQWIDCGFDPKDAFYQLESVSDEFVNTQPRARIQGQGPGLDGIPGLVTMYS